MRLPSHDRALARALQLDAWARAERAMATLLRDTPRGDPAHALARAELLEEVAEWIHWLAGRASRLRELEEPLRISTNRYGGGKRP